MNRPRRAKTKNLIIGDEVIERGTRKRLDLFVGRTYDFLEMRIPVEVVAGKEEGPVLFLSAAVHGDEINGTEIIRKVLRSKN